MISHEFAGARAAALVAAALLAGPYCHAASTKEPVGRSNTNASRYYTPANQIIAPAGIVVELPGMRPQAIALSPDGRLLVTSGKTHELVVLDPAAGKILQRVPLPSEKNDDPGPDAVSTHILAPDKEGQLSFTGLVFSPDGRRIYLANSAGSIKVFSVDAAHKVSGLFTMRLPTFTAWKRMGDIPSGLAVSRDGKKLYVVLNLSNRLAELDAATGRVLRWWAVGTAPFDVALANGKAYVSNWGGRRPGTNDLTGPAGRGVQVRVDPTRHIASEGSVSIIDLNAPPPAGESRPTVRAALREIPAGLHASALAVSPDERFVVVANAGSDTLNVIDTRKDETAEVIWTRQTPADLFGAQPNALTFDAPGKKLFVCNGTQNAVAVIDFDPGESTLLGLIPVGWFPGAVVFDAKRKALCVANIKGIGATRKKATPAAALGFNSHQYQGSLSIVPVPSARELKKHTAAALANMRYPLLAGAARPPRQDQPARPVPERVGEPSVFKHVVYIIKENRTYDQVFGDIKEGNGDPSLCIFGEKITPNHHRLAREFVLLDNTYCSGILSADGHQWADSGITTDYMERSFAGFPRSYPDGMDDDDVDALAYSPAGFIWDNVLKHGKTLRNYGEFAITDSKWRDPKKKGKPKYLDAYRNFVKGGDDIITSSRPGIESLRPYLCTNTVGWDMETPDVWRAAQFIKELRQFEARGEFPNMTLICLPNDHTSGTKAGTPSPSAYMADNDLALAQIVEAISHSPFWKETCIFVIEDDPQAGWDHVSGYRTIAFVISPWTKRRAVVSTQYNQTSILRTMELILGLPPMNQLDATATPMTDCFAATPDFTPWRASTNNIPLDEVNPEPKRVSDPLLRKHAYASAKLPLDKMDQCPENLFNRILWHAMKGSAAPYPVWAVKADED
jgi:DNA-binding beta-propeller fold protein YncE